MSFNGYANPVSAKTRLRKALVYNFKKIKKANGYNNDIGDVWEDFVDATRINNWPAVVIIPGSEKVLNTDMSDDLLHKELLVSGIAYLREASDSHLAREEFLADIETMIGNQYTLQDEAGDETCLVSWFSGQTPFGKVDNKPMIGFRFGITVRYRQDINDASVLA
jgi:hypothetical protein